MSEKTTPSPGAPGATPENQDPTTATVTTPQDPGATPETSPNGDLQEQIRRMEAALKKANAEAKTHRLEADELKKFKEQIESERLTAEQRQELARQDLEKQLATLQQERDAAQKQIQDFQLTSEVYRFGQRLNIVDLDAAAKLLDRAAIEYDDSGTPTNVEALLKDLVKERSWLTAGKQQAQTSGGATNPSRSASNTPPVLSWDTIGKMTPQEYEARRAEIQAWIAQNPYRHGMRR